MASGGPGRPAILFLHGFMGSSRDWENATAALGERFFCVAPDLPGHGASVGLPPESYTFESVARAVLGVLDELGIERATLVGYSMGGRLALYLALYHPERCAGLLLESASPGLQDVVERWARHAADEERASRLESDDFEDFVGDWYRQPLFASLVRDEERLKRTISARLKNDPAELARSLRGMGSGSQRSLWGELNGLRVPALAVAGELDEKFVEITHRMANLCAGMRVAVIPGAGHNVHVEALPEYRRLLNDFVSGLYNPSHD